MAGLRPDVLTRLAEAGAFSVMDLTRRGALWHVKAIRSQAPLPLFNDPIDEESTNEPRVGLPVMHLGEEVVEDYVSTRLTLRSHPMELLRPSIPGPVPMRRFRTYRWVATACAALSLRASGRGWLRA